jgi:uncharacterized protein YceK
LYFINLRDRCTLCYNKLNVNKRLTEMKTKKMTFRVISLLLAICILLSGCASTTMIHSIPDGAKVYLNEELAGTTPYLHSDTRIVGSTTRVRMEKEGYETLHTSFSRDEEVDAGAIIGGIFFLVPFLWTMKYKPAHTYELVPLKKDKQ